MLMEGEGEGEGRGVNGQKMFQMKQPGRRGKKRKHLNTENS